MEFPIYESEPDIPVGMVMDSRVYRPFKGMDYIEYDMHESHYNNGFHAFRFLEDAQLYAGSELVVYAVELSYVTTCGEFIINGGRNEVSGIVYVGETMKLLHLMQ